jgi:hypothetical protein
LKYRTYSLVEPARLKWAGPEGRRMSLRVVLAAWTTPSSAFTMISGLAPTGPGATQPDPQAPVASLEPRPVATVSMRSELRPESGILSSKVAGEQQRDGERAEVEDEELPHEMRASRLRIRRSGRSCKPAPRATILFSRSTVATHLHAEAVDLRLQRDQQLF